MVKQWELPEGYDLEQVNEYASDCIRKRHREWNRKNPKKVLEQRKRTYTNFLLKHGFTVIPPDGGNSNE